MKTRQHNHWLTSEIEFELRHRDWLLKHCSQDEYYKKKQRNNVKSLIRNAENSYFETIIKNKDSQKRIWTTINEIDISIIMSDDDLFKASYLTSASCQEKHVKFDVPPMAKDDSITYFRILKPKKIMFI